MTHHHQPTARQLGHRLDVLGHVEFQLHDVRDFADHAIERDEHCVAIVRRLHQVVDRQRAAGAGLRLDDHGLVQLRVQAVGQKARHHVEGATSLATPRGAFARSQVEFAVGLAGMNPSGNAGSSLVV
jgi:hypothetical protein